MGANSLEFAPRFFSLVETVQLSSDLGTGGVTGRGSPTAGEGFVAGGSGVGVTGRGSTGCASTAGGGARRGSGAGAGGVAGGRGAGDSTGGAADGASARLGVTGFTLPALVRGEDSSGPENGTAAGLGSVRGAAVAGLTPVGIGRVCSTGRVLAGSAGRAGVAACAGSTTGSDSEAAGVGLDSTPGGRAVGVFCELPPGTEGAGADVGEGVAGVAGAGLGAAAAGVAGTLAVGGGVGAETAAGRTAAGVAG